MKLLLLFAACLLVASGSATWGGDTDRARNGGYLGLFLREADGTITIERVHAGSMAKEVGFRAGDVIESVDGQPLPNGDALIKRLWKGRPARIALRRGDQVVEIETSSKVLDLLPKVGQLAPEFTLASKDGEGEHALAALLAQGKPVVLVFGSFT